MKDDRARLRRAKLIERVRGVEQRRAAADAFAAETRRAKLAGILLDTSAVAATSVTSRGASAILNTSRLAASGTPLRS